MPQYIVRVELHAASYPNYESLTSQMTQLGFSRTVVGVNRTMYQLPAGTYIVTADISLREVLRRVVEAANATCKQSAVIVAEYTEAMWQGLAVEGVQQVSNAPNSRQA